MPVFERSLSLYRRTIKRVRPAHRAIHWFLSHISIPLLEVLRGFRTMPDDPFWFRLELLTNRHERETVALLEKIARAGMSVLDVGAHVGYYSRHALRLVGPTGQVIAVEPHPRIAQTLRRNIARHKNAAVVQAAAAEQDGSAVLHDYLMMSASGSLNYNAEMAELQKAHTSKTDIAPRLIEHFEAETFTIQTVSLDSYLARLGVETIDLVKMDIEGAEIGALRGMQKTIRQSPGLALIMEYNPQALRSSGFQPEAALQEVLDLGFARVQIIEAGGKLSDLTGQPARLANLTAALMDNMGVVNLLLTRS